MDLDDSGVSCSEVNPSSIFVYWFWFSLEGLKIVDSIFLFLVSVPLNVEDCRDKRRCAGRRDGSLIGMLRASSASNLLMRERRLRLMPRARRMEDWAELWVFALSIKGSPSSFECFG